MLCEICKKKEATVFVKEMIFGNANTISMCEDCAKKHKEKLMPSNMQIDKLIESLLSFAEDAAEDEKKKIKPVRKQKNKKCPKCNSTYDEVIVASAPGCFYCYKAFEKEIKELIARVSREISYVGDAPKSYKSVKKENAEDIKMLLRRYKLELTSAIKEEDFDEAARLRDKIKELETNIKDKCVEETKKETKKTSKVKETKVNKGYKENKEINDEKKSTKKNASKSANKKKDDEGRR